MKSTTLRLPDELYDALAAEAASLGISLNTNIRLRLTGARFDNQIGATLPSPAQAAPQQPPTAQAQAPAPQPPRKYFAPNGRGGVTEAQTEVQTLLRQMFAMGATRADMLEAVLQGQTDQTVISFAGSAVDAFLRTQDTLDHLFDDEDPPPYDETVGLKLTPDE